MLDSGTGSVTFVAGAIFRIGPVCPDIVRAYIPRLHTSPFRGYLAVQIVEYAGEQHLDVAPFIAGLRPLPGETDELLATNQVAILTALERLAHRQTDVVPELVKLLADDGAAPRARAFSARVLGAIGRRGNAALPLLRKISSRHDELGKAASIAVANLGMRAHNRE